MSIADKLESLVGQKLISLVDEHFGDRGAYDIAKFLRTNPQVIVLELRGNKIGVDGIKQILNALQNSERIKSIILDWNQDIGQDVEGINAIAGFILTNKSIQHISVQNCSIGGQDVESLANSLKKNQRLLSLDLKWNNLGTIGATSLKKAIDSNETLIYLDLTGNQIPEDILDEIVDKIKRNHKKNPIPKDDIVWQGEQNLNEDDNQQQQQQGGQQRGGSSGINLRDKEGLNLISHLENTLRQEQLYTAQIKEQLQGELEELERKDRNELRAIQELESRSMDLTNQNKMMRFDIDRLRDEFSIIEKSNTEQVRQYEDRIRSNQLLMEEMEKKHKISAERILAENNFRVKEINRDWESRCRALEERTKIFDIEKSKLEDELKRVTERQVDVKIRHEEELRELTRRVEQEEYQKFQTNLAAIEGRIKAVEEGHDLYIKRNQDLIVEYQQKEIKHNEEIHKLETELRKLEEEHGIFQKKNTDFQLMMEKLKGDLDMKELLVDKLQGEIDVLNDQIQKRKQLGKEQIERITDEHAKERKTWEQEREQQLRHIQELERQLRTTITESATLRSEYLRLSEIVQANVNQTIFKTFSENQFY